MGCSRRSIFQNISVVVEMILIIKKSVHLSIWVLYGKTAQKGEKYDTELWCGFYVGGMAFKI